MSLMRKVSENNSVIERRENTSPRQLLECYSSPSVNPWWKSHIKVQNVPGWDPTTSFRVVGLPVSKLLDWSPPIVVVWTGVE